MRVKLLVSRAGADFVQNAGDEIEVPDDEAARMIAAGQATAVRVRRPDRAGGGKGIEAANGDPFAVRHNRAAAIDG